MAVGGSLPFSRREPLLLRREMKLYPSHVLAASFHKFLISSLEIVADESRNRNMLRSRRCGTLNNTKAAPGSPFFVGGSLGTEKVVEQVRVTALGISRLAKIFTPPAQIVE